MKDIPPPGIYTGVEPEEYHAWAGCSQSQLKILAESPAHLRDHIDHPQERKTTEDQLMGSAVHTAVLEPDTFDDRYVVSSLDGRTTEGKAVRAKAEKKGKAILKEPTARWVEAIARRLKSNKYLSDFMKQSDTLIEPSLVWDMDDYVCRLRTDIICPKYRSICDIKTSNATLESFVYEIRKYKYHWQAWWYLHGAECCGIECDRFVFIVAHKARPFLVSFHEIHRDHDSFHIAGEEINAAFETYKECMRTGVWPGYPTIPQPVMLPGRQLAVASAEEEPFDA